jgi:hypothetical protein
VAKAIRNADGEEDVDAPYAGSDAGQCWLWRKRHGMSVRDGEAEAFDGDGDTRCRWR